MRLAEIGIRKNKTILRICFLIALVFRSTLIAEESSSPSLAVLVYCDGGNQELSDKLQPLVEAEASFWLLDSSTITFLYKSVYRLLGRRSWGFLRLWYNCFFRRIFVLIRIASCRRFLQL